MLFWKKYTEDEFLSCCMHVQRNKIYDKGKKRCLSKHFIVKIGKRELTKNYIFFTKKKLLNPVAKFIVPDWEI
jgi:hypothetical protein